ncbi:hypothetical protein DF186_15640, partial [Enterococcus hirae]
GVTSSIQTQLDAKAASSHTHTTGDVTSGTFADARISQSSVTQHSSALEGVLDHDALNNYDANKHIDHTLVHLHTTEGLTGTGNLTANVTLA